MKKSKDKSCSRDSWETPDYIFNPLNQEFNFNVDLCASEDNAKCKTFFSEQRSMLEIPDNSMGEDITCWMNPPYSNSFPFVQKAWELSKHCKIVCLLKVDTSTRWWAIFWDHEKHTPRPGCSIRFYPKRIKFVPPPNWTGKNTGPEYASVLVIMQRWG